MKICQAGPSLSWAVGSNILDVQNPALLGQRAGHELTALLQNRSNPAANSVIHGSVGCNQTHVFEYK